MIDPFDWKILQLNNLTSPDFFSCQSLIYTMGLLDGPLPSFHRAESWQSQPVQTGLAPDCRSGRQLVWDTACQQWRAGQAGAKLA